MSKMQPPKHDDSLTTQASYVVGDMGLRDYCLELVEKHAEDLPARLIVDLQDAGSEQEVDYKQSSESLQKAMEFLGMPQLSRLQACQVLIGDTCSKLVKGEIQYNEATSKLLNLFGNLRLALVAEHGSLPSEAEQKNIFPESLRNLEQNMSFFEDIILDGSLRRSPEKLSGAMLDIQAKILKDAQEVANAFLPS